MKKTIIYDSSINKRIVHLSKIKRELNKERETIAEWNGVMYEIISSYPFVTKEEKNLAMMSMKESLEIVSGISYEKYKKRKENYNKEMKEVMNEINGVKWQ